MSSDQLFAGAVICTTGLAVHVKEQIRKIVLACGGTFDDDLALDSTTHLIADAVGSTKHRAATLSKERTILVVSPRWVFDSFRAHEALATEAYALRVLEGLVLCTTGLSSQTRAQVERLAEIHGAIYDPDLEVGRTAVLLAQTPSGAKYDAAVAHGIPVVHLSWLHACIEKGGLVDEAAYSLDKVLRPRRLDKQLRQELDDMLSFQIRDILRRYWRQQQQPQPTSIVEDATDHGQEDFIDLLDGCGLYLIGFTPDVERQLQFLIRMAMGTIYDDFHVPAVSHVIVSPVLTNIGRLEQLEEQVMGIGAEATVHFVSAKWLLDSLKCLRLEPEPMYPVEIEDTAAFDVPAPSPPLAVSMPVSASVTARPSTPLHDDCDDEPMPNVPAAELPARQGTEVVSVTTIAETAIAATETSASKAKFFREYGFVLVCLDPSEKLIIRATVKDIQRRGGGQAVALDHRDIGLVDPAQFDFVTHIVICSGVDLPVAEVEALQLRFLEGTGRRKLRLVSDLWVRCCLSAGCVLSHNAHELFSLTYRQPRSMFPLPLPLACFRPVTASTSVYVGVDRVVVTELLRMAGATFTSKLSKRNSHLVCLNPIGMKYDKAKEWGLAIVTARWVVQSLLQGRLLDTSLDEFQVLEDDPPPAIASLSSSGTNASGSGSRTTLGSHDLVRFDDGSNHPAPMDLSQDG